MTTEKPKKERKPSRTAFVAGLVVGAFAGALTTLLLLDDEPDVDDADDDSAAVPPGRSTARAEAAPLQDNDEDDRLRN